MPADASHYDAQFTRPTLRLRESGRRIDSLNRKDNPKSYVVRRVVKNVDNQKYKIKGTQDLCSFVYQKLIFDVMRLIHKPSYIST